MRVTFVGHASVLVESGGVSVLSDPWWRGPCFGAQWWNWPTPVTGPIEMSPPDFVYISHGHDDHLHQGTLKLLPRTTKLIVSAELDLAAPLRGLGFEVMELGPEKPVTLSGALEAWIWPTHSGDTLLVLTDGSETCINLNDAIHSAPRHVQDRQLALLAERFPDPDYVFCGYGIASHFPNCYRIPGKNPTLTAARRQAHFNAQWAYVMHKLEPRFGFPFAANVVFFEQDLVGTNEAVHNSERPTDRFRALYGEPKGELIDIAPGFQIESGRIIEDVRFEPLNMERLVSSEPEAAARANAYSVPSDDQVQRIVELLRANIDRSLDYLLEYAGDYTFAIEFRGSDKGIAIVKRGRRLTVTPRLVASESKEPADVTLRTRAVYLRRSLEEDYADEVLFVGSGAVLEYRERSTADRNLHRELVTIVRKHDEPPASRFGDNPKWVYHAKQAVKRLLGRQPEDLYDLRTWTVYE